jgi:hypothetical protein
MLRTSFNNPEDVNLLGLLNFYYEMDNVIKGVEKASVIKKFEIEEDPIILVALLFLDEKEKKEYNIKDTSNQQALNHIIKRVEE